MGKSYGKTLRETPGYADILGYQLLLRAGFIRRLASGIFVYLPLGLCTIRKIEGIIREEIERIGGQEVSMPVVHPADIWKKSRRWYEIGSELGRFKDRNGRDMALAMTGEEVVAAMMKSDIRSHRDLPALIYQIQTKWRDDKRPRGGLIRTREFTMKDSYSLDKDENGLHLQYRNHYQAYFNIFSACQLPVKSVRSDVGEMGGELAHEFMYLSEVGEDTLMVCKGCGYAANRQVAEFKKDMPLNVTPQVIEKVATPNCKRIEELSSFLNISSKDTLKAVLMMADFIIADKRSVSRRLVFAVIRGDLEVNETKLSHAINASDLTPATEKEIEACGAISGYASPVGLKDILIVADDSVVHAKNLVGGANEEGYHFMNINYGRDFSAQVVTDISVARENDPCLRCGRPLSSIRGVEVGNIFKLGRVYSEHFGCRYTDENGTEKPVIMGSYGIGIGRLMASIAQEHNDKDGLLWPISVAPYHVHLISLTRAPEIQEITQVCEKLYELLMSHGIEVLLDDRNEMPGIKFKDADLIGIPIRVTISERSLAQGGVEYKLRHSTEREIIVHDHILEKITIDLKMMRDKIKKNMRPISFR